MEAISQRYTLSPEEQFQTNQMVKAFNAQLNNGKKVTQVLGKDDFLKILITQLTNQDPTKPLEDKEFIAQMAQFSSLEQMNNMANNLEKLSSVVTSSQAIALLGKQVEINAGQNVISGKVEAVVNGQYPQVMVDGTYYDFEQIKTVKEGESQL